ncbi:hypothetical protein BH09MYX1_BH09MYX1_59350 [soil metagenome]
MHRFTSGKHLRRSIFVALGALAACGGRTPLAAQEDAETRPPLPRTCVVADQAIDWRACAALPYVARESWQTYCANFIITRGCEGVARAYYDCIRDHGAVCSPYDAGAGSTGAQIVAPTCDAALGAYAQCTEACSGGWVCSTATHCTCAKPNADIECCTYPSCPSDGSVPTCATVCGGC